MTHNRCSPHPGGHTTGQCNTLLVCYGPRAAPYPPPRQALERAAGDPRLRQLGLPIAVAFNPYLPDEQQRQQEERRRLRRKLEAGRGMVEAVYLQVCAHPSVLCVSLAYLVAAESLLLGVTPRVPAQLRPADRQRRGPTGGGAPVAAGAA